MTQREVPLLSDRPPSSTCPLRPQSQPSVTPLEGALSDIALRGSCTPLTLSYSITELTMPSQKRSSLGAVALGTRTMRLNSQPKAA